MDRCFVIAEIGSSPAPDWNLERWLDAAKATGAQAVKAQLFKAEAFPLHERRDKRALEFPRERWPDFVYLAHQRGLKAGASVFDVDAIAQVAEYGDFIKVAAREQMNVFLLDAIHFASRQGLYRKLPVYRSVSDLNVIKRGYPFDLGDVILATVPRYPTSIIQACAFVCKAALILSNRSGTNTAWGWSSHTRHTLDCRLAVWLGASIIEKHLAIESTDLEAGHSLLVNDFKQMVERIK